jgi:hypothetical protein
MKMLRRSFLQSAGAAALFAQKREFSVRTLTSGPRNHFFGYYGICPLNRSGRYLVCLESSFQDHLPNPSEPVAATLSKNLMVYNVRTREGTVIGGFPMFEKRFLGGDLRCDLHPRWNRSGDAICFDALDKNGVRQLHVATAKQA